MGKKSKLKKPTLAESKSAIWFGLFMLLGLIGIVYAASHLRLSSTPSDSSQVPIYFKRVQDAVPFPKTLDPSQFQVQSIREAYSAAKEIPDVLVQQPCYCDCQRMGHRSLLDCFRDLHATTCDICINEARLAGRLHREGKTTEEIRAAVIAKQWTNLQDSK